MDEAEQKRRREETAVFESFVKMQREAEERQFKAVTEQQRANSQLLLHLMCTFVKALLPQSEPPSRASTADPHPAASPQELSEPRGPATANSLTETTSSVVHDLNAQVSDKEGG